MARYGRDFTGGRYPRGYTGESRWGRGQEFGGGMDQGRRPSGRGPGWNDMEGSQGRGRTGRPHGHDRMDESWNSAGPGSGRFHVGDRWSEMDRPRGERFTSGGYGGYDSGMPRGRFERGAHEFSGRTEHGYRGRMEHDYDQDFGDRIREG